jgi:predicted ATP-dependent endonuclease of OLD family
MKLNYVELFGYKRFEKAKLDTSARITAVLGANEAGKSSLLKALITLNDDSPIPSNERTRDLDVGDEQTVVEATFLLNDEDRATISHLCEAEKLRWLKIQKMVGGPRKYELNKAIIAGYEGFDGQYFCERINSNLITEDLIKKAEKASKDLKSSQNRVNYSISGYSEANTIRQILNEFSRHIQDSIVILKTLPNNKEALSSCALQVVELIDVIKNSEEQTRIIIKEVMSASLIDFISTFLEFGLDSQKIERDIIDILIPRIPKILLFDEPQRHLASSYQIAVQVSGLNPALRNLLDLAQLDINILSDAILKSATAKIATILGKANSQLCKTMKSRWSQTGISVELGIQGNLLNVLVRDESQTYSTIDERSDGLRQFIALMNFLEIQRTEQPILLIDEVETHLHYDAQADLMQMFAEQQLASQIIYTTHSIGCLPEDLGTGIRLVTPIKSEVGERSIINNTFWSQSRKGFGPVLFGMGASTLAFIPVRKAVIGEGATDMLLLPTILRQVENRFYLGFQVVPGLSEVGKKRISLLQDEGSKVAFIVDNDSAGETIEKDLFAAGIEKSKIFKICADKAMAEMLEDCIKADIYIEAVNLELQSRYNSESKMTVDDLSATNRPSSVQKWCDENGIDSAGKKNTLSKTGIAYHLLDLANGERQEKLIRPDLEESFKDLYRRISKSLKA